MGCSLNGPYKVRGKRQKSLYPLGAKVMNWLFWVKNNERVMRKWGVNWQNTGPIGGVLDGHNEQFL